MPTGYGLALSFWPMVSPIWTASLVVYTRYAFATKKECVGELPSKSGGDRGPASPRTEGNPLTTDLAHHETGLCRAIDICSHTDVSADSDLRMVLDRSQGVITHKSVHGHTPLSADVMTPRRKHYITDVQMNFGLHERLKAWNCMIMENSAQHRCLSLMAHKAPTMGNSNTE